MLWTPYTQRMTNMSTSTEIGVTKTFLVRMLVAKVTVCRPYYKEVSWQYRVTYSLGNNKRKYIQVKKAQGIDSLSKGDLPGPSQTNRKRSR